MPKQANVFVRAIVRYLSGQSLVFVRLNLGFCRGKFAEAIAIIAFAPCLQSLQIILKKIIKRAVNR